MARKIESLNYLIEKSEAEEAKAAKDLKDHRIITRLNLDSEKDPALVAHAEREGIPLSNIEDWQQEVEGLARVRQLGRDIRTKYREAKTKLVTWLAPDRKSNITTIFGQEGYHPEVNQIPPEVIKAQQDAIAAINVVEAATQKVDSEVDRLVRIVADLHGARTGLRRVEGPFIRVSDEEEEDEATRLVKIVQANHPRTGLRKVEGPFERVTDEEDSEETIIRQRKESGGETKKLLSFRDVANILEESIPLQKGGKKKQEFFADMPPMLKELRRSPGSPSRQALERARDILAQIAQNERTTPQHLARVEFARTAVEEALEEMRVQAERQSAQVPKSEQSKEVLPASSVALESNERAVEKISLDEVSDLIAEYKPDKVVANSYKETLNDLKAKKKQPSAKTLKNSLYLINRMLAVGARSGEKYSDDINAKLEQAQYILQQELALRASVKLPGEVPVVEVPSVAPLKPEQSPKTVEVKTQNDLFSLIETLSAPLIKGYVIDPMIRRAILGTPRDLAENAVAANHIRRVLESNQGLPADQRVLLEAEVRRLDAASKEPVQAIRAEAKSVPVVEIQPVAESAREAFELVAQLAEPLYGGVDELSLERAIVNQTPEPEDAKYAAAHIKQILDTNKKLTSAQIGVLGTLMKRLEISDRGIPAKPLTRAQAAGK